MKLLVSVTAHLAIYCTTQGGGCTIIGIKDMLSGNYLLGYFGNILCGGHYK